MPVSDSSSLGYRSSGRYRVEEGWGVLLTARRCCDATGLSGRRFVYRCLNESCRAFMQELFAGAGVIRGEGIAARPCVVR